MFLTQKITFKYEFSVVGTAYTGPSQTQAEKFPTKERG